MIRSNRIGIAGIIVATLGICCAAFQDDPRSEFFGHSPQLDQRVAEKGFVFFGRDDRAETKRDPVDYAYTGLGIVALILGAVSYIAKENHRLSGVAAALGVVAIAWHYVLIGVVVAIVLMLVGSFS